MTIAHVVESFSGGVHSFLIEITKHLTDHRHVIIFGCKTGKPMADHTKHFTSNVQLIPWKHAHRDNNPLKDLKALYSLYNALKAIPFDVLHLHSSKAGFLGRLAAMARGDKSVVYTTHAAPFLRKDVSEPVKKVYIGLERFSSKITGTVVCCSKSEAEEVRRNGISCIYIENGTSIGIRQEKRLPTFPLQIVNCGRITEQKDPAEFNRIASHFRDDRFFQFKWVGDGELRDELSSPNISITGWLDREHTSAALKNADIFISTSRWEGLSLSILEAMSQGKALLLRNCVGNKDLVHDNRNGQLFDDHMEAVRALEQYIRSPEILIGQGKASREICETHYAIRDTCSKYEKLYNSLTHQSNATEKL